MGLRRISLDGRGPRRRAKDHRLLPSSVAPSAVASVTVDYRLPVEENSGLATISPLGSQFLPASLWYPQLNTPFAIRGADTAPFL